MITIRTILMVAFWWFNLKICKSSFLSLKINIYKKCCIRQYNPSPSKNLFIGQNKFGPHILWIFWLLIWTPVELQKFGIGRYRASKCCIPHNSIKLGIAAILWKVLYSILWYSRVHWNTPAVEELTCPSVGRYSLGNISLQRE